MYQRNNRCDLKNIMSEIQEAEKVGSLDVVKRLGRHRQYGRSMFAFSVFGEEEEFLHITDYGYSSFGENHFGEHIILTGIYKIVTTGEKRTPTRLDYYVPKNPRSGSQQTNRGKLSSAVVAWQNLTDEQRLSYNEKAKYLRMSGYNYFVKNYLLSN